MQLYITTFGAFLHIKDGMFQVKYTEDGETVKKKIPPKKVSAIVLDRGTSLTYEAVKTALSHNIDIVFAQLLWLTEFQRRSGAKRRRLSLTIHQNKD